MRILLVHGRFPMTYWGFQYSLKIAGKRATLPPLGLVTLAALLPSDWHLRLVDLNIEPLTDQQILWADAVLIGGMLIQAPSMNRVIQRSRALGRRTVVGGPGPSTSPELYSEADVVFGGEVEGRQADLVALIVGQQPATTAARSARPSCPCARRTGRRWARSRCLVMTFSTCLRIRECRFSTRAVVHSDASFATSSRSLGECRA